MTVKDLIKKLQQADPDAPVILMLDGTVRGVTGITDHLCRQQFSMASFPIYAVEILAEKPDSEVTTTAPSKEGESTAESKAITDYYITHAKWTGDKLIVQISPRPMPVYEIVVSDKQSQRNVLNVFNDQGLSRDLSFIMNFTEKCIKAGEGDVIKADNITTIYRYE